MTPGFPRFPFSSLPCPAHTPETSTTPNKPATNVVFMTCLLCLIFSTMFVQLLWENLNLCVFILFLLLRCYVSGLKDDDDAGCLWVVSHGCISRWRQGIICATKQEGKKVELLKEHARMRFSHPRRFS